VAGKLGYKKFNQTKFSPMAAPESNGGAFDGYISLRE